MNLPQLRALVAVADTGSITAAAARVGDMMVAHRLGVDSGWVANDSAATPSSTQEVSA